MRLKLLLFCAVTSVHFAFYLRMGTGNTFGKLFRITTFGESHGAAVGVVIDGCPPNIKLQPEIIQLELNRRKPGQSRITTPRAEDDLVEILSGTEGSFTTGAPIFAMVRNLNQRSQDYNEMSQSYRPSHADATYDAKYGIRSIAGGGRSSARETIARVIGGAVAKSVLQQYCGVEILAFVKSVQDIVSSVDLNSVTLDLIESTIVRCPDLTAAHKMIQRIDEIRRSGNSIGGVIELVARNVPSGLGSPVFDKLEAELAKACMSLPAAKGFEVGSGFEGTLLSGFEHNDPFTTDEDGRIRTLSNRSGGIQGGISNGENIVLRVAFKPTSTISQEQNTVTRNGESSVLRGKGRHDPCVLPRAVPLVESMVALTLLDALMQHHGQCELFPRARPNKLGQELEYFKS